MSDIKQNTPGDMPKWVRYLAVFFLVFVTINMFWSIADIQAYSDTAPTGRWSEYTPKLWPYLIIHMLLFICIFTVSLWKFGIRMLIPALYALLAGYYFYHMNTHLREPDDMFLIRPFYCILGLLVMGFGNLLTAIVKRFFDSRRQPSDSIQRQRRHSVIVVAGIILLGVAAFLTAFVAVHKHVMRAHELERIRYFSSIPELIEKSKDRDATIRRMAAFGLASPHHSENPLVLPTLLALANDPNARVRERAVTGLQNRPETEAFERIILAANDPSGRVRQVTVSSFKHSQDPRASKILQAMLDDPDAGVRSLAAQALAKLQPPLP